jgi:membrane-associated phospholipid phosphatase
MSSRRTEIFALLFTAIATIASYVWVDRFVAIWSHEHLHGYVIFADLTLWAGWLPPIAVAIICLGGLMNHVGCSIPRWVEAALISSTSLIVARAVKDQLKLLFGRTWPETWVNNNPSLINDGAFGFNPLHGGPGFESFPSGHTIAVCAVVATLWIYYPQFGLLYLVPVLLISVGLIGANYHFVSDVVAGSFLGTSVAIFCISLFSKCSAPNATHRTHGVIRRSKT